MKWLQERDEKDRELWTSSSVYHDDGSHFQYRLTRAGRRQWTMKESTAELLSDADRRRRFDSLADAKAFVEEREREIIAAELPKATRAT